MIKLIPPPKTIELSRRAQSHTYTHTDARSLQRIARIVNVLQFWFIHFMLSDYPSFAMCSYTMEYCWLDIICVLRYVRVCVSVCELVCVVFVYIYIKYCYLSHCTKPKLERKLCMLFDSLYTHSLLVSIFSSIPRDAMRNQCVLVDC